MKKILITLAVTLFISTALTAKPTGLNIGGGVAYSGWTTSVPDEYPTDYVGPYFEIGYDLKVAKNSYLYFGARYFHGLNLSPLSYFGPTTESYAFHWGDLFIPIRFQQNFNIGKNSTFYVEAGPAAGVLLFNVKYERLEGYESSISKRTDLTYSGEPRANVYLGGNVGFNIHTHCKIYAGGDYGFIGFSGSSPQTGKVTCNRWQLNFGACYVF